MPKGKVYTYNILISFWMDGTFQKCLTPFLFLAVNIVAGVLSMTVPSEAEQHTKAANMTIHPEFDPTFGSDDLCMIKVHFLQRFFQGI